MKKIITVISIAICLCAFHFITVVSAASKSPAAQIQSMVRETAESNPELFEYINGKNWAANVSLAHGGTENNSNYTVKTDKVVAFYDLGYCYAASWMNNKEGTFIPQKKKWAIPYYFKGSLSGVIVISTAKPYSYSVIISGSDRLFYLLFKPDLLNSVLSKNNIKEITDCKAVFGLYSQSPSLLYINNSLVLPVDVNDYDKITAVDWQEYVEAQAKEEAKEIDNWGFVNSGGSGIVSSADSAADSSVATDSENSGTVNTSSAKSDPVNNNVKIIAFVLLLFIVTAALLGLYLFKKRSAKSNSEHGNTSENPDN